MAKAKPIIGLNTQAPIGKNARLIAYTRLEEIYSWGNYVDHPYYVRELHNLRIAAKRLRYTLEVFEEVLPEACQPLRKELEQMQEELGALHDSDVMIALLRLCLGSQDSGTAYEQVLAHSTQAEQHKYNGQGAFALPLDLVAGLVDPVVAPSAEQRSGLEQMLQKREWEREKQYAAFRQHWYQLQARDFRHALLAVLDSPDT